VIQEPVAKQKDGEVKFTRATRPCRGSLGASLRPDITHHVASTFLGGRHMRSISWLIFSLGLGVFLSSGSAGAQDAVKPSVQVVIGPDGSVKVIDPKTGKEVPSVVTKLPAKPAAAPAKELQIHLELAHFELEKLLNAHAKQKKDAKDGPAVPFRIELEFVPTTGGEPKVIQFKPKIVQVPA